MFAEHGEGLIAAFEQMVGALNQLCMHILDELPNSSAWVYDGQQSFINDRDKAIYVLKHLVQTGTLTPQETYSCPGIIGAAPKTLKLIDAANAAKDTFKIKVQECKKALAKDHITKFVREILNRAGYNAINLKQAYRHIKYINYLPYRVSWFKGHHSMHKVISIKQAEDLLSKRGQSESIQIQLNKLSLLQPQQKLVIYKPIKPVWIANITSVDKNGKTYYEDIRTSLPIFYLHDKTSTLPDVCLSTQIDRSASVNRKDKKLEDKPFLQSIHAYRYKKSFL